MPQNHHTKTDQMSNSLIHSFHSVLMKRVQPYCHMNCKLGAVGILSFRPEISTPGGLSDDLVGLELGRNNFQFIMEDAIKAFALFCHVFSSELFAQKQFFKLLTGREYLHTKCEYHTVISNTFIQVWTFWTCALQTNASSNHNCCAQWTSRLPSNSNLHSVPSELYH